MKRPSRSRTETGIVTRLVSTLITSFSSFDGVGVGSAMFGRRPLIKTGGRPPLEGKLEPFSKVGGGGVDATRGRDDVFPCPNAKAVYVPNTNITVNRRFIFRSSSHVPEA